MHALQFEAANQASKGYGRVRVTDDRDENEQEPIEEKVQQIFNKTQWRCWSCENVGHTQKQ